jgi:acetyl-CoA C-acetyltransferase
MTKSQTNGKNGGDAVILSGVRTPTGRLMGSLSSISATELGAATVRAAVERAGIDDGTQVDEVFMGHVVTAGVGQGPARQAAIHGGLPDTVGATTINKVCGSGLKAVMLAAAALRAGDGDLFVAGGMESMSQAPFLFREGRAGQRFGHAQMIDANVSDGLWCSFMHWEMGCAAEFIADKFEVTREEMDEFALGSHRKAIDAIDNGRFKAEIVPVEVKGRKGTVTLVDTDEPPRRDTSMEALARLKPAFQENGRVTAGNAPSLNDAAAAVVLASRDKAKQLGRQPLARIVGYAQAAVDPQWIFHAPAEAIPALLEKVGWSMDDVDLIELNEAFAAQVLADARSIEQQGLHWDWDKVNVNGGAVALGHPIGASGARILVTLLYALQDRGLKRGIASLCLGGGEAVALAVELE